MKISAIDFLPNKGDYRSLVAAARQCRGCDLYRCATQTVFGEGNPMASIVFVGEQPGDVEDRMGHPFVGPAGTLLQQALRELGFDRTDLYVTNAVKHFKFAQTGRRRLHKKPRDGEIAACRPWLAAELQLIRPRVLVCLGVTAIQSVFQRKITLKSIRGTFNQSPLCENTLATIHPSAILRVPSPSLRRIFYEDFVSDLKLAHDLLRTELDLRRSA